MQKIVTTAVDSLDWQFARPAIRIRVSCFRKGEDATLRLWNVHGTLNNSRYYALRDVNKVTVRMEHETYNKLAAYTSPAFI